MPRKSSDLGNAGRNMLIVGKSGTGKTHMLGTVADVEKLYIISCEAGLSTISHKSFDYDECNSWDEIQSKVEWFFANYKKEGYTALALDSFDRAQRYLIQSMLDADKANKLSYDRFNEMLGKLRKMLDILNKTEGFTFIATCHNAEDKDGSKGIIKESLHLEGAIKFEADGYFDNVCVSRVGKDGKGMPTYWLEITGDEKTVAKTRLKHLAGKLVVPADYKVFIAK